MWCGCLCLYCPAFLISLMRLVYFPFRYEIGAPLSFVKKGRPWVLEDWLRLHVNQLSKQVDKQMVHVWVYKISSICSLCHCKSVMEFFLFSGRWPSYMAVGLVGGAVLMEAKSLCLKVS